jgi:peptidoglycan LD-endopeptidase LytH
VTNLFIRNQSAFRPVVAFDPGTDDLLALDLTLANTTLNTDVVSDTALFSDYISSTIAAAGARYGIGGYNEHRTVYSRSAVFDGEDGSTEPRRLHLGTDIWGVHGTPVHAPLDGTIHSFADNDKFGDYGATIILQHELEGIRFYTLYGHLSLRDLTQLSEGKHLSAGKGFAHFGEARENGNWPPHLHFQIIYDIGSYSGDYPGVCRFSERELWLKNSPDPDLILQMNRFISK